jgi:hypothetical protein
MGLESKWLSVEPNHEKRWAMEKLDLNDDLAFKWTPKQTLRIQIHPEADWSGLLYAPEDGEKSLHHLANGKPLEFRTEKINGVRYQEISGPGAAEVARVLRDVMHKNFDGSASIPRSPNRAA